MDRIYIRDLKINCIIGANPHERVQKQDVLINITLECDLRTACASDQLADTLDYKVLKDDILAALMPSEHELIERMADHVAGLCLRDPRVHQVTVTVDKPGALTGARSVAVEITRRREDPRLSGL